MIEVASTARKASQGATSSQPPGLGRSARPARDVCPTLRSASAACPHALARSDPPNLARKLLGEPQVAIRPARDAERLAALIGHTDPVLATSYENPPNPSLAMR